VPVVRPDLRGPDVDGSGSWWKAEEKKRREGREGRSERFIVGLGCRPQADNGRCHFLIGILHFYFNFGCVKAFFKFILNSIIIPYLASKHRPEAIQQTQTQG